MIDAQGSAPPFFGIRLHGLSGVSFNYKLGVQYELMPTLTLGMAYTSKSRFKLEGGELRINAEAAGLGRVTYADAEVKGLALPQVAGIGLAWYAIPNWIIADEMTWYDWSSALSKSTVIASQPNSDQVDAEVFQVSPLNWRDQYA